MVWYLTKQSTEIRCECKKIAEKGAVIKGHQCECEVTLPKQAKQENQEYVVSILEDDLTPAVENKLEKIGLEVDSVGMGSTEFSTTSKKTFDEAIKYLKTHKISASI